MEYYLPKRNAVYEAPGDRGKNMHEYLVYSRKKVENVKGKIIREDSINLEHIFNMCSL